MAVISTGATLTLEDLKSVLDETENLTELLFELSEDNIEGDDFFDLYGMIFVQIVQYLAGKAVTVNDEVCKPAKV